MKIEHPLNYYTAYYSLLKGTSYLVLGKQAHFKRQPKIRAETRKHSQGCFQNLDGGGGGVIL